nr:hypothetical protein Iba_chr09aCG16010 [Ipomoea batatas]
MEHTNASHLSPVLAVGGRGDVFVAIEEPAGHAAGGAVREGQVVVLHDRSGRVGRGGDEDWHGAEVKEHEGTIESGEEENGDEQREEDFEAKTRKIRSKVAKRKQRGHHENDTIVTPA